MSFCIGPWLTRRRGARAALLGLLRTVKEGVAKEEADKLKAELEEAGAGVELR